VVEELNIDEPSKEKKERNTVLHFITAKGCKILFVKNFKQIIRTLFMTDSAVNKIKERLQRKNMNYREEESNKQSKGAQ
jgi:hypothetical protein